MAVLMAMTASCSKMPEVERFSMYDGEHMKQVRRELRRGFSSYRPAYTRLVDDANSALKHEGWSVTTKPDRIAGVMLHEYASVPDGWAPNPLLPNGLPWHRDDKNTSLLNRYDRLQLEALANALRSLSLAWYFTGDRPYAVKAGELLRIWFLDTETAMMPHLEYAHSIPGRTGGRYTGLRDGMMLTGLLDAIIIAEAAGTLKRSEVKELREWFGFYLDWLLLSSQGAEATAFPGYDAVVFHFQAASIAHFLELPEVSVVQLEQAFELLPQLFLDDGRPSTSASRPAQWEESMAAAGLLVELTMLSGRLGYDVMDVNDANGQLLFRAIDHLSQNVASDLSIQKPASLLANNSPMPMGLLLRSAAKLFDHPEFKIVWSEAFSSPFKADWRLLVYPEP